MPFVRILLLLMLITPATAAPYFVHCYDFGCKTTQELRYSEKYWDDIKSIFASGVVDSYTEKQAIRRAVATMERISGELSGTYLDKGGNYPGSDIVKQMDCIDESTNTFQYLIALEQLELLKWHRVDLKNRRIVWLVTHWTAVIREIDSNARFAVDSWHRDNGELPYIQPLEDWKRKRDFPVTFNPELATS
ncbi:MAG: hypothetical protein GY935_27700 [Gammaproteobacteria bacterium]|nr:hypothetical protein [Gammaproteobacteria bacterium]